MPATTVHAGFALLLAAGLLWDRLDRRALAVLLAVLVVPELDTAAGLVLDGAHRALLHNLVLPGLLGAALLYDVRLREASWLRARFGDRGVRAAAVALFVHVFAHVALDYVHLEGVNLFYPLVDRFFTLDGDLYLSTTDGLVQTFFEFAPGSEGSSVDVGGTGTTENVHVDNPVEPDEAVDDGGDEPVERKFPVAVFGWRLYVIATGLFVLGARRLQGDPCGPEESPGPGKSTGSDER